MFISLDIITWNKYVHFSNFHLLSSLQWIFFVHVGKNKQQTLEYYEWLKICFIATLLPIKDTLQLLSIATLRAYSFGLLQSWDKNTLSVSL